MNAAGVALLPADPAGNALRAQFEALRAREYSRLDRHGDTYLDYTGGGQYAESQVREHHALLDSGVFGNPHSSSPTSVRSTRLLEQTRTAVLDFFGASPEEYVVIFTQNASAALRLVGEAFPFAGGRFVLTYDNHNSVNGLREFARRGGARTRYLPIGVPELRADDAIVAAALDRPGRRGHNLFAFPAQSNFSGVQHPLEWIELAHERGWDVLVDCASFVPTNRLDLGAWHPDFAALSFYKMFGYPTGIGCLLARRSALARLRRPWFAGGTVWGVSVSADFHVLLEGGEAFEDGSVDYLNLPAVEIGLRHLSRIGIDAIHEHVMDLTGWLLEQLLALHHDSGAPLVEIYGPRDGRRRGATVALNFLDPDGAPVDERVAERIASERRISVRTGCLCNPGGFEGAWQVGRDQYEVFRPRGWQLVKALLRRERGFAGLTLQDYIDQLGLRNGGAVRISLGVASTLRDVAAFVDYARTFLDQRPDTSGLPPRLRC